MQAVTFLHVEEKRHQLLRKKPFRAGNEYILLTAITQIPVWLFLRYALRAILDHHRRHIVRLASEFR